MTEKQICDNCRFYYAYGLTHGACMLYLLSKKDNKDKDVNYTDSCPNWTSNDDRKKHQIIIFSYEKLKKEHALKNIKKRS